MIRLSYGKILAASLFSAAAVYTGFLYGEETFPTIFVSDGVELHMGTPPKNATEKEPAKITKSESANQGETKSDLENISKKTQESVAEAEPETPEKPPEKPEVSAAKLEPVGVKSDEGVQPAESIIRPVAPPVAEVPPAEEDYGLRSKLADRYADAEKRARTLEEKRKSLLEKEIVLLNAERELRERENDLLEKERMVQSSHIEKGKSINELIEKMRGEFDLKEEEIFVPKLSRREMLWRSAIVPGWGHYATGQQMTGTTYFLLAAAGLAGYSESSKRVDKYSRITNGFLDSSTGSNAMFSLLQISVLQSPYYASEQDRVNDFWDLHLQRYLANSSAREKLMDARRSRANILGASLFLYLFQLGHVHFSDYNQELGSSEMIWRSAVLPGWGHFSNGNLKLGLGYFFLVVGSVYGYSDSFRRINKYESITERPFDTSTIENSYIAYVQLQNLRNPDPGMGHPLSNFLSWEMMKYFSNEPQRKKLNALRKNNSHFLAAASFFYLFQLWHAAYSGKSMDISSGNSAAKNGSSAYFSVLPEPTIGRRGAGISIHATYTISF